MNTIERLQNEIERDPYLRGLKRLATLTSTEGFSIIGVPGGYSDDFRLVKFCGELFILHKNQLGEYQFIEKVDEESNNSINIHDTPSTDVFIVTVKREYEYSTERTGNYGGEAFYYAAGVFNTVNGYVKCIENLVSLGVKDCDIQTTNITLNKEFFSDINVKFDNTGNISEDTCGKLKCLGGYSWME